MGKERSHRLVILSGPSCAGKTPLLKAVSRFFPRLHESLAPLILYNSRSPRPGEEDGVDYHFRRRAEIEALRSDERFIVREVRGDLQAVDIEELGTTLETRDVLYEGNPYVASILLAEPRLKAVAQKSVFLSPLSAEEIAELSDPDKHIDLEKLVTEVMRRKLLRRARRHYTAPLGIPVLEDIERRASSAYRELKEAPGFDWVIVNHDGEDSEHWDAFSYPLGDAGRAMRAFVALCSDEETADAERWEHTTLR